jgi:putative (di)nucleoside polyphosphate hydrolase
MTKDVLAHEGVMLEELFADPIVWLVMRADGVTREQIVELLRTASSDLGSKEGAAIRDKGAPERSPGQYRPCVGIMLLNARNQVLVGRRRDVEGEAWQMPQGGIDDAESPKGAAYRELKEEIGADNAEVLAESKNWLYYDLPADLVGKAWGGRWRGQRQKWFVMRLTGSEAEITVDTDHPEFSSWKWVQVDELGSLVVSFKRNVYLSVIAEFRDVIDPPAATTV